MAKEKTALEVALEAIATEQAKYLLQDLRRAEKRTPALYNAITALLKHHQIEFDPVAAAKPDHPVGALAGASGAMIPPTFEQDEERFH